MATTKTLRICKKGHKFYKSTDCPTCPICEKEKEPATGFLALLSNPARNTLVYHGIDTIKKLAAHTERDVLNLHGMGKASLPTLKKALEEQGLSFKEEDPKKKVPARKAAKKAVAGKKKTANK